MCQDEWWTKLRADYDDTVRFFSERGRTGRENGQVSELLRCLGVSFTDDEVRVPKQDDDLDVYFRDARFQNVEQMAEGRRRHAEVKERAERARRARSVADLEEEKPGGLPMTASELLAEVSPR